MLKIKTNYFKERMKRSKPFNLILLCCLFVVLTHTEFTTKSNTFYFDDQNVLRVGIMDDNSLTYDLFLPNDSKVKISTTLGDGSKDSFVLSLNNTEIVLENYLQTPESSKSNLKTQGEYILLSKDFEQRRFKIRRFILQIPENGGELSPIIPLSGAFLIEYSNELLLKTNKETSSDVIYFTIDMQKRQLKGGSGDGGTQIKVHGIGLYIIWTCLSYLLLITGRYMKVFYQWRMLFHIFIGLVVLICSFIFIAFGNGGKSDKANSFGKAHKAFGTLIYPWMIFEVVSGFAVKIALIFFVHMSCIGIWCRVIHNWTSYGCLIAANLMNLSGLYLNGSTLANYLYIHFGIMIIITIVLEINLRVTYKWKYEYINQLEKKELQDVTMEQFLSEIRNGKKLALFDDYVLNINYF